MNLSPLKHFSAWFPLVMSLAGLALVVGHYLAYGIVHEADEGVAVYIFWLLMGIQVPVVAYFALAWLPRKPLQALLVLALQGGAWLAAWGAVFFLT